MKSIIIPAQITTVEDKIAGNLSLNQIVLLLIPVFWTGIVYVLLPNSMEFTVYKLTLIAIVSFIAIILAVRIKGKLISQWLTLLIRFYTRPAHYVADKNDTYLRKIEYPVFKKTKILSLPAKAYRKKKSSIAKTSIDELETLQNLSLHFKFAKKGAVYVKQVSEKN